MNLTTVLILLKLLAQRNVSETIVSYICFKSLSFMTLVTINRDDIL